MKNFRKFFVYIFSIAIFVAVCFLGTACDFSSNGHTFSEKWTTSETEHWHECTNEGCSMYSDKAFHTSSDWIIDKEATDTEDGVKHKECIVCKYIMQTDVVYAWNKFEETKYTWNSDFSKCTAYKKCKVDNLASISETVNVTCEVKQEASCEQDRILKYTATFTNSVFGTQTKEINLGGHCGHDYGEVTYKWMNNNSVCVARRICKNDTSHVDEEYATTTYTVTTQASCQSDEKRLYTAQFTNSAFETQTKNVTMDGTQGVHIYGETTYTWSNESGVIYCTASRECENCDHIETERALASYIKKNNATCEKNEKGKYIACFENQNFSMQTQEVEIENSALGHSYVITYEWNEDNTICSAKRICEHDGEDIIVQAVLTKQSVKSEADCVNNKILTYTATFTNPVFTNQTKNVEVENTKLGHLFGEVSYTWNSDYTTCTAKRTCSRDSHVEEEIASIENGKITTSPKSSATCEENEVVKYTANFENTAFSTQTKDVEVQETSLGHDWSVVEYIWTSDYSKCTAIRICGNNAEHIEIETVDTVCEISTTKSNKERRVYTATFINSAFEKQQKTEIK